MYKIDTSKYLYFNHVEYKKHIEQIEKQQQNLQAIYDSFRDLGFTRIIPMSTVWDVAQLATIGEKGVKAKVLTHLTEQRSSELGLRMVVNESMVQWPSFFSFNAAVQLCKYDSGDLPFLNLVGDDIVILEEKIAADLPKRHGIACDTPGLKQFSDAYDGLIKAAEDFIKISRRYGIEAIKGDYSRVFPSFSLNPDILKIDNNSGSVEKNINFLNTIRFKLK